MEFFVGELIAFRYRDQLVHVGEELDVVTAEFIFIAHDADDGHLAALGEMGLQAMFFNKRSNLFYRFLGGMRFHYNNHSINSFLCNKIGLFYCNSDRYKCQ